MFEIKTENDTTNSTEHSPKHAEFSSRIHFMDMDYLTIKKEELDNTDIIGNVKIEEDEARPVTPVTRYSVTLHDEDINRLSVISPLVKEEEYEGPYAGYKPKLMGPWTKEFMAISHKMIRRARRNQTCKKLKCPECNFKTTVEDDLRKHIAIWHTIMKKLRCKVCTYSTYDEKQFKKHVALHEKLAKRVRCTQCKQKSSSIELLKIHIAKRHRKKVPKVYPCPECDYKAMHMKFLSRHLARDHRFSCEKCKFKTNIEDRMRTHMYLKHKIFSTFYGCHHCPYKSIYPRILNRHIKDRHSVSRYICKKCEYETNDYDCFEQHEIKHRKVMVVLESDAVAEYSKQKLFIHVNPKQNSDAKYKCSECEYISSWKSVLERHVNSTHKNQYIYFCNVCSYRTNFCNNFKSHVETVHLQLNKFGCGDCKFKSRNIKPMRLHFEYVKHQKLVKLKPEKSNYESYCKETFLLPTEESMRRFKCAECAFETVWKKSLKRHIQSRHKNILDAKGKLMIKCGECTFETVWEGSLERHIKLKHENKLHSEDEISKKKKTHFKCAGCSFETVWKKSFIRHVKAGHKNNLELEQPKVQKNKYIKTSSVDNLYDKVSENSIENLHQEGLIVSQLPDKQRKHASSNSFGTCDTSSRKTSDGTFSEISDTVDPIIFVPENSNGFGSSSSVASGCSGKVQGSNGCVFLWKTLN